MLIPALTTLSLAAGAALPAAELVQAVPAFSWAGTAADSQAALPYASDVAQGESPHDGSAFGPAADTDSLDGLRGGDGTTSSIVMNGNVADNRATNVVTGANTITDGAFANASGVPMVVQNTGANVLIQNATVINLQLR